MHSGLRIDCSPFEVSGLCLLDLLPWQRSPRAFVSGYLPGLEIHDPVGSSGNLEVMGDHHNGHLPAAIERLDQMEKLIDMVRVQTSRRLICEEDLGVVGECASNGRSLALAPRQLGRLAVLLVDKSNGIEELGHTIDARVTVSVGPVHHDLDIASNVEVGQQVVKLEHDADGRPPISIEVVEVGQVVPLVEDLTLRRHLKRGEELQECGLPRSGWPRDGEPFSRINGHRDTVKRSHATKLL